jgi:hypothetical protein
LSKAAVRPVEVRLQVPARQAQVVRAGQVAVARLLRPAVARTEAALLAAANRAAVLRLELVLLRAAVLLWQVE